MQATRSYCRTAAGFALLAAVLMVPRIASAQALKKTCTITPAVPVAVLAGGSTSFTANCGSGLTWHLTGAGTLDNSGNYTAPALVVAQNQSRGCQELPNNSPFNVPVNTLPVDPKSAQWMARIAQDGPQYMTYHNLKFYPAQLYFYDNVVDGTSPEQMMHFYYTQNSNGYQDTDFAIPPEKTLLMETGRFVDAYVPYDRHMFTINKSDCTESEIYNLYFDFQSVSFTAGNPTQVSWTTNTVWQMPQNYGVYISGGTGVWAAANGNWRITVTGAHSGTLPINSRGWGLPPSGMKMASTPMNCNNCNSAGGQKFSPASYAQLGGADAAGMPMSAASVKLEEWYAATQAGRSDLGHAIRTTLSNTYLTSRNVWPASMYAYPRGVWQISAASNGSPAMITSVSDISTQQPCANYTYAAGCQFGVIISGLAGNWSAVNGTWTATAVDNHHFTIPVNTGTMGVMPQGGVFDFDFLPYGATLRLKASFDVDSVCTSTDLTTWCPYAKVWLNTIKKYGLIVADGTIPSDNWDSGTIDSEFHPNVLRDAASNIFWSAALQPIESYLEVVNRSSQQLSTSLASYQMSSANRTYVTVCGTNGCATNDILLQGTTIGTDRERLAMAAGVSYQLNVWTHGNVKTQLSYSMDTGITGAYVSSSGVLTMPNCQAKERGMVTVRSVADPEALPLYIEVNCIPRSSDGGYRLALGNYTGDYVDSTHKTWWGSWANNGFNNPYEAPGLWFGAQLGSWQGYSPCSNDTWSGTDSQLYSRSTSFAEDTKVDLILPNGSYTVTLFGEPGFGGMGSNNTCGNTANQNVYDWQVQGQTVKSWIDGYVQAGNQPYHGYTLTTPAMVTDQTFNTVGRMRVTSVYGMSWSSLLVAPSASLLGTGSGGVTVSAH